MMVIGVGVDVGDVDVDVDVDEGSECGLGLEKVWRRSGEGREKVGEG